MHISWSQRELRRFGVVRVKNFMTPVKLYKLSGKVVHNGRESLLQVGQVPKLANGLSQVHSWAIDSLLLWPTSSTIASCQPNSHVVVCDWDSTQYDTNFGSPWSSSFASFICDCDSTQSAPILSTLCLPRFPESHVVCIDWIYLVYFHDNCFWYLVKFGSSDYLSLFFVYLNLALSHDCEKGCLTWIQCEWAHWRANSICYILGFVLRTVNPNVLTRIGYPEPGPLIHLLEKPEKACRHVHMVVSTQCVHHKCFERFLKPFWFHHTFIQSRRPKFLCEVGPFSHLTMATKSDRMGLKLPSILR